MDALALFGHPARLRIVHAMRGGRTLTTTQLCALLPDVSKAMVYRHVEALVAGTVLEVAEERPVRGAVERHYRLRPDRASIDARTFTSLSLDDHRRGFAIAVAALVAEFSAYLDQEGADPAADLVGYRQHGIWLDPDELRALITGLRDAITPHLGNTPTPDRTRYLLSPILFPSPEPPPDDPDPDPAGARMGAMSDSDLPKIGAPATRALASIGVTTLVEVAERSEAELLALHGFGPRALGILREALAAQGLGLRG
jgi:hypothetical protein